MTESLRERKKTRTREALVAAATELFEERGFDAVTIDEIAAKADVSQRTFFRYFGSKEAVLFSDQDEMLAIVREAIASRPYDEPPLLALQRALLVVTHHYAQHRELHLRRARLASTGAAIASYQQAVVLPQWQDALAESIGDRLGVDPAQDMRPELLSGVAMAVMGATGVAALAEGGVVDVAALLSQAFAELKTAVDDATAAS